MIAIAITLLVLEISVPLRAYHDLWRGIADQWPSYLGYATSFLTVGGIWLLHHAIFRRLDYADPTVIRLNLGLLMAVSFLPFPTRTMAEAIRFDEGEHVAVLFYGACLLVTTGLLAALARYSAREQLVSNPEARAQLRTAADRISPSLGFYGLIVVLAAFAPKVAVFGFLALAIRAVFFTK